MSESDKNAENEGSSKATLSPEQVSQFTEAFSFLNHEREDVRKMAMHGIAAQSKDNKELWLYLSTTPTTLRTSKHENEVEHITNTVTGNSRAVEMLLQYLHIGGRAVLGDLLTILVNCSADGTCAELLVAHKIVRKAMRLLDGLQRIADNNYVNHKNSCNGDNNHVNANVDEVDAIRQTWPLSFIRAVQEMTLMLLNNLTASHVSAIDDLLQKEDEDMRGFYLNKLQVLYENWMELEQKRSTTSKLSKEDDYNRDKQNNVYDNDENAANSNDLQQHHLCDNKEQDNNVREFEDNSKESAIINKVSAIESVKQSDDERTEVDAASRDLSKWILQILLNMTRSFDGQEMVMDDAEWRSTLIECMSSPVALHRLLVAQCYRNCGCSQRPRYDLILKSNALVSAVSRLGTLVECEENVQMCLAEFIACMMESEDGLAKLDGINAKQMLNCAIARSLDATAPVPAARENKNKVETDVMNETVCNDEKTNNREKEESIIRTISGPNSTTTLKPAVITFLQQHVLPYLDDIVDAYLAPGSDALD